MSWNIYLDTNTVKVNKKIAKELFSKVGNEVWYSEDEILDNKNRLYFNSDHSEWMDYIGREEVQNILKKHKVSGMICFVSYEGDNAGSKWGYQFDGQGNMFELKGKMEWSKA